MCGLNFGTVAASRGSIRWIFFSAIVRCEIFDLLKDLRAFFCTKETDITVGLVRRSILERINSSTANDNGKLRLLLRRLLCRIFFVEGSLCDETCCKNGCFNGVFCARWCLSPPVAWNGLVATTGVLESKRLDLSNRFALAVENNRRVDDITGAAGEDWIV